MTIACFAGAGVATHHLSEPVADEVHVVMVVLASLLAVEQVVTVIMFGWSWANCSRIGVYNVLDLLLTAMFLGLSIVGPWEEGCTSRVSSQLPCSGCLTQNRPWLRHQGLRALSERSLLHEPRATCTSMLLRNHRTAACRTR